MSKTDQICQKIQRGNPWVTIKGGTNHRKVMVDGALICIIPYKGRKEGLSPNLLCQLRRAGIVI